MFKILLAIIILFTNIVYAAQQGKTCDSIPVLKELDNAIIMNKLGLEDAFKIKSIYESSTGFQVIKINDFNFVKFV